MATSRAVRSSSSPATVYVSATTADEIGALAASVGRSVAFLVERALAAAPEASAAAGSHTDALTLATDEDDPADLRARIGRRAGARPLDRAIEGAWAATRTRFVAWAERERAAQSAERADELDAELAAAHAPGTTTARLTALAQSVYPKVRALVAAHPSTPGEALERLARDREPYVRDAVENRRQRGG